MLATNAFLDASNEYSFELDTPRAMVQSNLEAAPAQSDDVIPLTLLPDETQSGRPALTRPGEMPARMSRRRKCSTVFGSLLTR